MSPSPNPNPNQVRLRGGGGVLACGFNRNGRCGVPEADPATTRSEDDDALLLRPTRCAAADQACAGGATIVAMAAGSGHAGFVCSDGTARLFGRNDRGQCGRSTRCRSRPAAGEASAAAAEQGEGEGEDEGGDGDGEGDGDGDGFIVRVNSVSDAWRPVAVRPKSLECAGLDCGGYHTLARTVDGRVWQWGDVSAAQRGAPPHRVEGLARIAQVVAGATVNAAVDVDGRAQCARPLPPAPRPRPTRAPSSHVCLPTRPPVHPPARPPCGPALLPACGVVSSPRSCCTAPSQHSSVDGAHSTHPRRCWRSGPGASAR